MHEPKPGQFDWSGQADAAEFCRIAQEEGLWVILRPGPYSCAEWEMGGLPWWLLKNDDIQLRTRDPRYMAAAKRYLKEVGRVLGPLQITHGGPILMVQVENEYGFFGKDADYMGELRQALLDAGFDVPLFDCNPPQHLKDGFRPDLFPVVNFGSDPASGFKALREILPKGPLMCGEFYPGWFDTWGAPHHTGNTARYLADLEYMLKAGASFSIYMAHGGTTFGFWSGATALSSRTPRATITTRPSAKPAGPRKSSSRRASCLGATCCRAKRCLTRRQEPGHGHRAGGGCGVRAVAREPSGRGQGYEAAHHGAV